VHANQTEKLQRWELTKTFAADALSHVVRVLANGAPVADQFSRSRAAGGAATDDHASGGLH